MPLNELPKQNGEAKLRKIRLVQFVVSLAMGIATTITIALACAWNVNVNVPVTNLPTVYGSDTGEPHFISGCEARGFSFTRTGIGRGTDWRHVLVNGTSDQYWDVAHDPSVKKCQYTLIDYKWGWPFTTLFHREIFRRRLTTASTKSVFLETANAFHLHQRRLDRRWQNPKSPKGDLIPTGILWKGFCLSTLLWATLWMSLFAGLGAFKKSIRTARGMCPTCGYNLFGQRTAGCPECGWNRLASDQEEDLRCDR